MGLGTRGDVWVVKWVMEVMYWGRGVEPSPGIFVLARSLGQLMGSGVRALPEWIVRSLHGILTRNLVYVLMGGGASRQGRCLAEKGFVGSGACGQGWAGGRASMSAARVGRGVG